MIRRAGAPTLYTNPLPAYNPSHGGNSPMLAAPIVIDEYNLAAFLNFRERRSDATLRFGRCNNS
jgi:hypothetical protein